MRRCSCEEDTRDPIESFDLNSGRFPGENADGAAPGGRVASELLSSVPELRSRGPCKPFLDARRTGGFIIIGIFNPESADGTALFRIISGGVRGIGGFAGSAVEDVSTMCDGSGRAGMTGGAGVL